ncbi:tetratricopeptide repeat protein [Paraburkholderia sp. BCC1885]|uniref:tetratricopeptide repeat protein n=1 Tax=Paraburkholderia sp. BCC1885 TaxID=2562669 RepID=UPI0011844CAD|nr:tetratricopeptide repeat protein [Paraburkholderia sp. BCC1885]
MVILFQRQLHAVAQKRVSACILIAIVSLVSAVHAETTNSGITVASNTDAVDTNTLVQMGKDYASRYPREYTRAVVMFRQAAERGNVRGEFLLGQSYADGLGVEKDTAQAEFWYRKAAEQGNIDARRTLMNMFYSGQINPVDVNGAGPWWRELVQQATQEKQEFEHTLDAANQGKTDAMVQLGFDYLMGVGVTKNFTLAKAEFEQAAQRDRTDAQCFFDIVSAKKVEQSTTVQQCLDAATQGSAVSQLAVSYMYRTAGFGVPRDLNQMVHWESNAAEQGLVDAQIYLAGDYETGNGITKNEELADVWYKKAAEQGSFVAMGALSTQAWEAHNPLFAHFQFKDPLNNPELQKKYQNLLIEHKGGIVARDLMSNLFAPSMPRNWGLP